MDSRIEKLLTALLNGDSVEDFKPRSRAEHYLKNCILKIGVEGLPDPQSRLDALLYQLAELMPTTGGDVQLQTKTATPGVNEVVVIPDTGYALSKVIIEAVTSAIDANIKAENIKEGVSILGVSGSEKGYDAGYQEGCADGKQLEYDRFWDIFQQGGNRTDYKRAFSYWTDSPIPKYTAIIDAKGGGSAEVFALFGAGNTKDDGMVDLTEACAKLDFSQCEDPANLFMYAYAKNINVDLTGAKKLSSTFSESGGGKHDNIKLKVSASCEFYLTFYWSGSITTLEFLEGSKIGRNGLNLQWSTHLDEVRQTDNTWVINPECPSLKSLLDCLDDKSEDKSTVWKITVGAANLAKIEEYLPTELSNAYAKGWIID